jgi:hypothetical protein
LCAEARRQASAEQGASATLVAGRYGVAIEEDRWKTADGRIGYLAECSMKRRRITLNRELIDLVEERGDFIFKPPRQQAGQDLGQNLGQLAGTVTCAELVIAHELYHLITRRPSSPVVELEAHVFARALTGWLYSPIIIEHILKQGR